MRAILQRVSKANVIAGDLGSTKIKNGLLVFIAFSPEDNSEDEKWLIRKILNMRIFPDKTGQMNLSLHDIKGEVIVISQFTLYADTKKGNRPGFTRSASPKLARILYESFLNKLKSTTQLMVKDGFFGANMNVKSVNTGPVTIILDSKNKTI